MAYPEDPLGIRVRIAPGADVTAMPDTYSWSDITPDVNLSRSRPITITAGAEDEQQESESEGGLILRNYASKVEGDHEGLDGRYTIDNPESDLYDLGFDQGCPVEIAVDIGDGAGYQVEGVQFVAEATDTWPGRTATDNFALTELQLAGLLRRLQQGKRPKSTLFRHLCPVDPAARPAHYWPMETRVVPDAGLLMRSDWPEANGGAVLRGPNGTPGGYDGSVGSYSIASFGNSGQGYFASGNPNWSRPTVTPFTSALTTAATTGDGVAFKWGFELLLVPADTTDNKVHAIKCGLDITTGTLIGSPASIPRSYPISFFCYMTRYNGETWWPFTSAGFSITTGGGGTLAFSDTQTDRPELFFNPWDGVPHYYEISVSQAAGTITLSLTIDGQLVSTKTLGGHTLGLPYYQSLVEFTDISVGAPVSTSTDNTGTTFGLGHVMFETTAGGATGFRPSEAAVGFDGEQAHERIERVCGEDGVPVADLTGRIERSRVMGPQTPDSFVPTLRECEKADGGILDDHLGYIDYVAPHEMVNRDVEFTIDGTTGGLYLPFAPVTDDAKRRNDVTISPSSGAPGQSFVDDANIDRVGRFDSDDTLNTGTPAASLQMASWAVRMGTVPGKRYPAITLDLMRSADQREAWFPNPASDTNRLGSRVQITSAPRAHRKGNVDLQIRGYTLTILGRRGGLKVEANTIPYGPYEGYVVESSSGNRGRLSLAAAVTVGDKDTDDTSFTFTFARTRMIDSAAYPSMFPFDIVIRGERMTVTAVTGTTTTQTVTVTRSVNGVVRAQPAGGVPQLYLAAGISP